MSRYIDADKILKKIESRIGYFNQYYPDHTENIGELEICEEFINDEPTAEVKPIVYGEWIETCKGLIVTDYKCSICGRTVRDDTGYDVTVDYPYCNCGADMRKESEEEE